MGNPLNAIDPDGDSVRVFTETSGGTGHSWISVGESDDMTVYTYGRYSGTDEKSSVPPDFRNGPGVLIKLDGEAALRYNNLKKSKTNVNIFTIKDANEQKTAENLQATFNSSTKSPPLKKNIPYMTKSNSRIIDQYKLLENNCTTFVISQINKSGSKAMNNNPMWGNGKYSTIHPTNLSVHLLYQASPSGNGTVDYNK